MMRFVAVVLGMHGILIEHMNTLTIQFQTNMKEFVSICMIMSYYAYMCHVILYIFDIFCYSITSYYMYYILHDSRYIMHIMYYRILVIFDLLFNLYML